MTMVNVVLTLAIYNIFVIMIWRVNVANSIL